MPQSTLTTSNPSSLKNNLQPPYKLLSSFSLLSMQLQLLIQTSYIKTSFWLSLVTQLHQNISLQMAGGLWTQTVFFFLITESILSTSNLCICILQYNHDHILARHYGQNKTLELVHHRYSQPSLYTDVQQFCKFYITCMQFKPQCYKPYRSLKQLSIPEQPWNSISMDFIEKLLSFSGFNIILVIVNQLTKQVIFILTHNTITSVCSSYVLQIQCFFPCYLQQRLGVCIKLLLFFRHYSRHVASPHFRLPPQR